MIVKIEKIALNLFMLKGKTLQKADVCITQTSKGEESMMNRYLKLTHMLECDLNILFDRKLFPELKSGNLPFYLSVSIPLQVSSIY